LTGPQGRDRERVTIIVLTCGNLPFTRQCLESLLDNTPWPDLELIVVDNGSTDGTPDYLRAMSHGVDGFRTILNPRNLGFARGVNQGVREATGTVIVLLNNDTVVTRGWLEGLAGHLLADPARAMVGPVTNSVGNEAQVDADYTTIEELELFAVRRRREFEGRTFEIPMLTLFCVAMRRGLFDEVGMLDERFEVGMFEDDDLCRRIRSAGRTIVCCEDVFVHHAHSATFRSFSREEYLGVFAANRKRYEEKWGERWTPHRHRSPGRAR
jgi:GT2 family glycosyltransferase